MPDKSRSQKRKSQYEEFISQFSANTESKTLRNAGEKLGKLWDDVKVYMDPEKPVEIDRKKLQSFLDQYVSIADSFASVTDDKERQALQKLRKIMGKDIRIINSALKQKNKDTFNLQEIFDNSRSIMVKVDEKAIETKGGAVNSRMHIKVDKDNIDGYFTVHNEPYDFNKVVKNIAISVAGEDKDCQNFVRFLYNTKIVGKKYPSAFMNQFMMEAKEHMKWNVGMTVNSDVIKTKYESNTDYRNAFVVALSEDIRKFP